MRGGVLIAVLWTLAAPAMAQEEAQPAADESAEATAAPAEAPAAPPAGDPVRGKAISYTCLGCHGIPNYKNAFPSYSVPKLEGQHAEYMVTALQAYRSGERSHITMRAMGRMASASPRSIRRSPASTRTTSRARCTTIRSSTAGTRSCCPWWRH
jgi:cytochrome c553